MSYNEELADRVRTSLLHLQTVAEKKMFGGLAFMVNNKMCVTIGSDRIMCRIDPAIQKDLLKKKGCSPVVMKGSEYKGYVHLSEESIKSKKELDYWVTLALEYNKEAKASKKKEARDSSLG